MTTMLVPFMSCSAKLPIYSLLVGAFFPRALQPVVMIGLYAFGVAVGISFAAVLKRARFRGQPVPFVMELPNYRLPAAKSVARLVWDKAKGFVKKAFTVVLAACVVIWFLQTFDARLNVVDDVDASLLAGIGGLIAPLFAPLGFGDWRAATALMTGFMAKESVVSTLTQVMGEGVDLTMLFTPVTAMAFLAFVLCAASRAAHARRSRWCFCSAASPGWSRSRCILRARWSRAGSRTRSACRPGRGRGDRGGHRRVPEAPAHRRRVEGGLQNLPRQLQELQRLLPLGQGSWLGCWRLLSKGYRVLGGFAARRR